MDKDEFKELMEEGRSRFSSEQNTILKEQAEERLGEEISYEETIKDKVRLERNIELSERYHTVRRIRNKFKETRNMISDDDYEVDTNSDNARTVVDKIRDIDERSAELDELEELKTAIERFIVEEKDIESPELE